MLWPVWYCKGFRLKSGLVNFLSTFYIVVIIYQKKRKKIAAFEYPEFLPSWCGKESHVLLHIFTPGFVLPQSLLHFLGPFPYVVQDLKKFASERGRIWQH